MRRRDFLLAAIVAPAWRLGQAAIDSGTQPRLAGEKSIWWMSDSLPRRATELLGIASESALLPADASAAMEVLARLNGMNEFVALLDDRDSVLLSVVLGHCKRVSESVLVLDDGKRVNAVIVLD